MNPSSPFLTPDQFAAFLAALPFLTLAAAWMVGLACLTPKARPAPVPVKRRHLGV